MSKKQLIALTMCFAVCSAFGADVPISEFPAASSISGADVVPIVQSGTTKKATFTVQQGLWDTFYQPKDADLTALAALTGTHTIYYRSAANTWTAVTIGSGLDFTGATLSATGSGFAPSDAHYLTSQAETGLSNEVNLGSLSTGLLKVTVSGSVATPSVVVPGSGIETFLATPSSANLKSAVTDETGSGGALVFATGPTLSAPVLGTPASGTLTNCTGLPVAAIVGDTSTALGVGTIELGHATATTLSGSSGVLSVEGVVVPTISSTNTFTNKRNTPRITTITSSATPTINTDNCDAVTITALAAAITSMTTNLSGTPNNFDKLIIRIKDDGTARAITWGASFEAKGVALPTTTVISKVLTVGFIYDSVSLKWGCVASAQEQ